MKKEAPVKSQPKKPAKKKKTIKWIVIAAGGSISLNWSVAAAAIAFCAVIGVLFGSYPAAKASKLQPIDALRAE